MSETNYAPRYVTVCLHKNSNLICCKLFTWNVKFEFMNESFDFLQS